MKKRIFAIMLTAMMAVSVAACNNDSGSQSSEASKSSTESTASQADTDESKDDESKEEESKDEEPSADETQVDYDVDADALAEIEKNLPMDKLGDKTKATVRKFASKELKLDLSIALPEATSEDSAADPTGLSSMLSGSTIKIGYAKNGNNDVRVNFNMTGMSMDILTNSEGTYFLDSTSKTALFTKAQETSGESGDETAAITGGFDAESIKNAYGVDTDSFTHTGDGEGEFNGATYSYEGYSIKVDPSAMSMGLSVEESTAAEPTELAFKVYYDGNDLKGIAFESDGQATEIVVDTFDTKADVSEFTVPSDYTIEEDETGMGILGMFGGLTGMGGDIPTDLDLTSITEEE